MGGVALPAVRAVDRRDEASRVERVEARWRTQLRPNGEHAIDPPPVRARAQVETRLDELRNPLGMFENEPVEVRDVKRAIRPGLEHRRPEPGISGREEFAALLILRTAAREADAVWLEHFAMHKIVNGIADEDAGGERLTEEFVAIRRRAARAGDVVEVVMIIETLPRAARGEQPRPVGILREVAPDGFYGELRIARKVMIRQIVMPEPRRVEISEPIPPVVPAPPKLRRARNRLETPVIRAEAEVTSADVNRRRGGLEFAAHRAVALAVRAVNPVIQAVVEAVQAMLLVAFRETFEERRSLVGTTIAIGVLGEEYLRCGAHEHAVAPRHDAVREAHAIEEDCGRVVAPVAVRVFEKLDAPAGLALAVEAHRIIIHLRDPQLSIRPPVEGDGRLHERFRRDEFDLKPRTRPHRRERLLRRQRRRVIRREQFVERPPVHLVGQMRGVLVLHPHRVVLEPHPVVRMRPRAHDGRNVGGGERVRAARSGPDFVIPPDLPHQALVRARHEEMERHLMWV